MYILDHSFILILLVTKIEKTQINVITTTKENHRL